MDWKPNGHKAQGLGIEPGLSGPQRRGSPATLTASPILCRKDMNKTTTKEKNKKNKNKKKK